MADKLKGYRAKYPHGPKPPLNKQSPLPKKLAGYRAKYPNGQGK